MDNALGIRLDRYKDYEHMDTYPSMLSQPYSEDATGWLLPEPSAVDRLAAVGDPSCPAADRCREYDEWQARRAEDAKVVQRITDAPARHTIHIDVATRCAGKVRRWLQRCKRQLRGDQDARVQLRPPVPASAHHAAVVRARAARCYPS